MAFRSRSEGRHPFRTERPPRRAGVQSPISIALQRGSIQRVAGSRKVAACAPTADSLKRNQAPRTTTARASCTASHGDVAIFARNQPAIDFDLAPIGNDIDALSSLDPTDRQGGRAEDRVGVDARKLAGVF